jgi:hypothetical protein
MRASISTWRTGDVELADQVLHLLQAAADVGDEDLVGARLGDDAAALAEDAVGDRAGGECLRRDFGNALV